MNRYITTMTFLLIVSIFKTEAQDRMLAHMNTVPQSLDGNPAATLPCKFYFGLPAMNNFYLGFQNRFAYNDIIKRRADDSLWIDQKGFIDALSNNRNLISIESRVDILNFGFRIKKNFFTLSNSIRTAMYFSYPKDMMKFLVQGNAAFADADEKLNLEQLKINATVWSEIALGYQRHITNRINVGGRLKLLHGLANINTVKSDISMYTDPNSYAWTIVSNAKINMASIVDTANNVKTSDLTRNTGFSVDLGGTYRFSDQLAAGIGVLDFGGVFWKSNTQQYSTSMKNDTWTFDGLNLNRLFIDEKYNGDIMKEIGDTITEQFQFNDSLKENYSTWIYPKIIGHVYYKLGNNNKFGFYSRNDIANGTVFPSFTLSYNRTFGRILELGVSYGMIHESWLNVGAGMALRLGGFQFYCASENILSFFNASSAKNAYVHFGFNLTFGKWKEALLDNNKTSIDI